MNVEMTKFSFSYFVTVLVLMPEVGIGVLDVGVREPERVEPARLVGILEGVPSSLMRDRADPWRETGREVPGVRLDLIGIDVFVVVVVVVKVLEGVRRP